jgi:CBS domain-containing protein
MKPRNVEKRLKVSDVMSTGIITISPDNSLIEAGKLMGQNRIDNLLVVENNKPSGIITTTDIVKKAISQGNPPTIKVKEIMSSPIKFVSHDEEILHVVDKMLINNTKRFPVLDMNKQELVGIVTIKDVLRAMPDYFIDKIEWLRIHPVGGKKGEKVKGMCDLCRGFTEELSFSGGLWVCQNCE